MVPNRLRINHKIVLEQDHIKGWKLIANEKIRKN